MRLEPLVFLAMLWGITTLCGGCRTPHPLRDEFAQAVLRREPLTPDLLDTADESAVRRFVHQHGRDAIPLYRSVIVDMRHPRNVSEERELAAAVEGIAATGGASTLPLLRELVADVKVPFWTLKEGILALQPGAQAEALEVMGERFQHETDGQVRLEVVAYLSRAANPAAIPVLRALLSRETDEVLRNEMELGILVLQSPDACRLVGKRAQGSHLAWRWLCQYRCPGFQPGYSTELQEECPDRTPLPLRSREHVE
ncbi:HEAT repeat domain-containing protein [Corallococcus sicarius]|uniref:HEAT repeat domain-containing protein n=1 Tax=Corallococcus sicarius TaxID=2316726 RepID=UPI0011C49E5E|nr:HEAT repeat domain-containing protein [Corallococcus sicarius]